MARQHDRTTSQEDRHREASRRWAAKQSLEGRDIGPIPPVADENRRASASESFRVFCETYFPETFRLAWSDDHKKVIGIIETTVKEGGRFALAMPRGSGKTTLCEKAALWSVVTGYRKYPVIIGSDMGAAQSNLESIKNDLETNETLGQDFPEVCYPIACLEQITQRCRGQFCEGEPTRMEWKADRIILPTIAGSQSSGAVIQAAGLTGRIRGMKHATPDGTQIRPDLGICDDPQTDESAWSPSQTAKRIRLLSGAVAGLAGPGTNMSIIVPCTVIARGDLAEEILDRDKHPNFQGHRTKALHGWPKSESKLGEYAEVRADGLRQEDGGAAANEYWKEHREVLEEGARASWPASINDGDASAIQSLINKWIDRPEAFMAEYQNEPMAEDLGAAEREITADDICEHIMPNLKRGVAPAGTTRMTAFLDPDYKLVWWMVVAWNEQFTGHVVAYGAWPDQGASYFTHADAKKTIARSFPKQSRDAQTMQALETAAGKLLNTEWQDENGVTMRIDRCVVDSGLGEITDAVFAWARQTTHAAVVMPSKGLGLTPSDVPLSERKAKTGQRIGHHWRINPPDKRRQRHLIFDANRWKSRVATSLKTYRGSSGAITIHAGTRAKHRMLSDHLTSERPRSREGTHGNLDMWEQMRGRNNDWFDCLIGNAVAASTLGIAGEGQVNTPRRARRRVKAQF